jgi:hypothetical protein
MAPSRNFDGLLFIFGSSIRPPPALSLCVVGGARSMWITEERMIVYWTLNRYFRNSDIRRISPNIIVSSNDPSGNVGII